MQRTEQVSVRPSGPRGFTLVELMIALLLTGVMSVVIYSLFDTTSDNFVEVDALSDTTDRLRFATERVRNDLQMAGALMTPDSALDPLVQPVIPGRRIAGVFPYETWQDDTSMYGPGVAAANPHTSMDGIVVMGAFDMPVSFEIAGITPGEPDVALIYAHPRGLMRLNSPDPFRTTLAGQLAFNDPEDPAVEEAIESMFLNVRAQLIRVTDRQGFQQFIRATPDEAIDASYLTAPGADERFYSLTLPIEPDNSEFGPQFKRPGDEENPGGVEYGLDAVADSDVAYDAALIDAYWYHVVQDPQNPNNMQLVRDRLCAYDFAEEFAGGAEPENNLASECGIADERVVIANHVADFQIWFDCAVATTGAIVAANNKWSTSWVTPNPEDEASPAWNCVSEAQTQMGRARSAHVRLTLHTPTERKTQAHIQFEDRTGVVGDPGTDPLLLRTFDPYPTVEGAAPVVTMQSDFELPNFAQRNTM